MKKSRKSYLRSQREDIQEEKEEEELLRLSGSSNEKSDEGITRKATPNWGDLQKSSFWAFGDFIEFN